MSRGGSVLVTGGSRGIGAAICVLAARRGWRVAVNYARDEAAAGAVVARIAAEGGEAFAVRGDVSQEAEIAAMFAETDRRFGRLDGLVNNAGVVDRKSRVDQMGWERLERMMRVNLIGTIACAREAVRRMSTTHGGAGGAIVNVSSIAATLGGSGEYVDYAAAKAGVDALTVGLAKEVATEGIRVNAVRPGIIDTDIHASGGQPDRIAAVAPLVPMKRAGTAEEVAEAVLFLLSDVSPYTTGAILNVGGGR